LATVKKIISSVPDREIFFRLLFICQQVFKIALHHNLFESPVAVQMGGDSQLNSKIGLNDRPVKRDKGLREKKTRVTDGQFYT
jgi:hypothetical protein